MNGPLPTRVYDVVASAALKFPVPIRNFPILRNIFPVSFGREFTKRHCSAAISCSKFGSDGPEVAKFPVKFPVSREFAWRRVRSAPASPARCSVFDRPHRASLQRVAAVKRENLDLRNRLTEGCRNEPSIRSLSCSPHRG
jgi:hypothetical protein